MFRAAPYGASYAHMPTAHWTAPKPPRNPYALGTPYGPITSSLPKYWTSISFAHSTPSVFGESAAAMVLAMAAALSPLSLFDAPRFGAPPGERAVSLGSACRQGCDQIIV